MLLGKRPRPPMRRTASITEFSFDMGSLESPHTSDQEPQMPGEFSPSTVVSAAMNDNNITPSAIAATTHVRRQNQKQQHRWQNQHQHRLPHESPSDGLETRFLASMVLPRNPPRNSGDLVVEPAHFLRACGLCNRSLGQGKDIYMYRGEIAFCSLECRQQHMNQDERKEKCSFTSMKIDPPQVATGSSEPSSGGGTIAAA